jgi:hypothetical protein
LEYVEILVGGHAGRFDRPSDREPCRQPDLERRELRQERWDCIGRNVLDTLGIGQESRQVRDLLTASVYAK